MHKLKLTGLVLVATVILASCQVHQPRQNATGAWLVHASQEECVKAEGVIGDNDARRPYYFGIGRAYYSFWNPIGNWDCAQQWGRPRGYVAARFANYKWIPGPIGEGWTACTATNGWAYNTENNIYEVWSGALEPVAHYTPPCGGGWYFVTGCGGVLNGGTWHTGCVNTDQMYFSS